MSELTLPESSVLERHACGIMLASPTEAIPVIEDGGGTSLFFQPEYARLYNVARHQYTNGRPCELFDLLSIYSVKAPDKDWETWFMDLYQSAPPSITNLDSVTAGLSDLMHRRKLILRCQEAEHAARDMDSDISKALSILTARLDEGPVRGCVTAEEIAEQAAQNEAHSGICWYMPELDRYWPRGIPRGSMNVIGAYSGCGKTTFALSVLRSTLEAGHGAIVNTCEMTGLELMYVLAAGIYKVNSNDITHDHIAQLRKDRMPHWGPLYVFQQPSCRQIITNTREVLRRHNEGDISLNIIDYLQITPYDLGKAGNRENELSSMAQELKYLSMSTGLPSLVLSQLNQAESNCRLPTTRSIRESQGIVNAADSVLLLDWYRLSELDDTQRERYNANKSIRRLLNLGKMRKGADGPLELQYWPKYGLFKADIMNIEDM